MQIFVIIVFSLAALLVVIGVGLRFPPKPFTLPPFHKIDTENIALPANLPKPVERFYRVVYGERLPETQSAILVGRGKIRPFGVWLRARFVFVHIVGHAYRHYIEATFFGIPFLRVNEGYVDGESFFESPMGTYDNDANTNQGANLALWAEAGWFPVVWIADERVHWEPIDDVTALLFVPFEGKEESFVVRFEPETGLVDLMEAMRYRDPGQGKPKILWITHNEKGACLPGTLLSAIGSATWLDQGKPWAIFTIEDTAFNVDVHEYIHQRGI